MPTTPQPARATRPEPSAHAEGLDHDAVRRAYDAALENLRARQQDNGAFAGEVVWNPMLVCQYVMACHIMGVDIPEARKRRIIKNLEVQVHDDGGWGMHPDSGSWLFHTVLGYVALRLLGQSPEDPLAAGAARWIRDHGGVHAIPSWGRVWLAMLGLYPWDSVQPILPELWLLPDAAPIHPRRLYCHMRLIYLGLSYVYGAQLVADPDPVLKALRRELYPEGYRREDFERFVDEVAVTDLFESPSPGLRAAFRALRALERFNPGLLRRRALDRALEHILFEFRSTDYVCLSPVNGLLFSLALHATDPEHPELPRAIAGLEYWMWEDEDEGLRIAGARSDIWDTSFALLALGEGPDTDTARLIARDAAHWLPLAQMKCDVPDGRAHYRAPAKGGWGFANEDHPWPVSDCTAEALEGLMLAEERGYADEADVLTIERKLDAVAFILQRQNDDGGFGSYESRRGHMFLRNFNPAEIYGNCMLEYSYVECSASCIRVLAFALEHLEHHMDPSTVTSVRSSLDRGLRFLTDARRPGGAWPGFWGINFTYAAFFAAPALRAGGLAGDDRALREACDWLVARQREDGGWGEAFEGLLDESYVEIPAEEPSHPVQTAWAVMALMSVDRELYARPIERAMALLLHQQEDEGGWPSPRATGVFFNTAVLDYRLYRHIFPAWALARYLGSDESSGQARAR